ncbi:MAG: hypothetical protein AAFY37_13620, partial [Pseudomonadota bacterium]
TPLSFLMDPTNHQTGKAFYRGKLRRYYEMPHGGIHEKAERRFEDGSNLRCIRNGLEIGR